MKEETRLEFEKKTMLLIRDAYDQGFMDGCEQEREQLLHEKASEEKRKKLLAPVNGLTSEDIKEAFL